MNKLKETLNNLKSKLSPLATSMDIKFQNLIPNPKLRKVFYIAGGSLFGFMLLIIVLGILFSPVKKTSPDELILNKPVIETATDAPQIELGEMEKKIIDLETRINELRFPESTLNIPQIESNIEI